MILANVVSAFASLYILSVSLSVLNRMTAQTCSHVRIGYIAITFGAACAFVWSFDISHDVNRVLMSVFVAGVALYFRFERRRASC